MTAFHDSLALGRDAREEAMTNTHEHHTSGTALRSAHQMSGRGLVFHVAEELNGLRVDLERT
jgi:hypothetical protein